MCSLSCLFSELVLDSWSVSLSIFSDSRLISVLLLVAVIKASVAVTDIDFREFVYSDMMSQMSVIS